jgi:hypothetical protein
VSDGKPAISKPQLVEARVKNFEKADANDDDKLDAKEKVEFAALVVGRKQS